MVQIEVMRIAVSEAKTQLTELVRLAEAGEEVILTSHGQASVRLVPVRAAQTAAEPHAARSQDFGYGKDRLAEADAVTTGRTPAVFRPVPVRGEPLSMTVLRDRR